MKLSVLDQSPISKGQTAAEALQQTLQLAQYTEDLGYHRFWVAEHHNTNGLAGTSPEVLISRIASVTHSIRVGSGGILLPQYSPFKVAENFKTLEALFPGRIDLGMGRSPGGGKKTRLALTDGLEKPLSAFSRQVKQVHQFLHNDVPKGEDYFGVSARPLTNSLPQTWVLGLSELGARRAAVNSTGFTFGHFINPENEASALAAYRQNFKPSQHLTTPKVNVCIFAVCAETQDEAEELALSQDKWLLQVEKGLDTRIPSVQEVIDYQFSNDELQKLNDNRRRALIGTPHFVAEQLQELSESFQVDEFLIITNIFDFEAKKKSYRLLAEACKN
ncbi:LLM class flavin-dependent oxidoreductase [Halobacillus salinarum]|uniref:LLM class flavin-dependent oxidoreductase n=1 Tax=Halobacillus salinarum TaxID=2932257 RepID=A0ABY4EL45_9BACI|nr:LLM class flavin-dependent oxidoreductase [Halobacillus salinarum]UOQ42806.1 LLM class flavin-dependent oxidoreductase [Halobacillus salinarum]